MNSLTCWTEISNGHPFPSWAGIVSCSHDSVASATGADASKASANRNLGTLTPPHRHRPLLPTAVHGRTYRKLLRGSFRLCYCIGSQLLAEISHRTLGQRL